MSTREELSAAVFGDESSIDVLASKIDAAQRASAAIPDINVIADAAAQRLAFNAAVKWFEGEYATELKDPMLKQVIYNRDAELAQSNPQLDYKTRLAMVGDEVRSWYGRKYQGGKTADEETETGRHSPDRTQRRPAVTVRPNVREDVDGEPSPDEISDTIQAMARARGQNVAAKHTWKVRG
jgi:hypothetical protein